jgi:hypothetical protein
MFYKSFGDKGLKYEILCFSECKASWMGMVQGSFTSLKGKRFTYEKAMLVTFVCICVSYGFNVWNKKPILKQCTKTLYYRKSPRHIFSLLIVSNQNKRLCELERWNRL